MFSREVEIVYADGFTDATALTRKSVDDAIGYLATWAICGNSGRYAGKVKIVGSSNGDLHARYTDKQGNATYFLMGLRDSDGSYSFHS